MQVAEQNLYINFTKSVVDSFEEFVNNVDKHGELLSDAALILRLKQVGKKLQTIFNKWENIASPLKKSRDSNVQKMDITVTEVQEETKPVVDDHCETTNKNKDDEWDEFSEIIAGRIGNRSFTEKKNSSNTEVSSSTIKLETESSTVENATSNLSRKTAELVRKFKMESVKEHWILGSDGKLFVEEYSAGSWKCFPCKLDNLSTANIISHVSGTKHGKKVDLFKRESSLNRHKSNSNSNTDLSSLSALLSDSLPELFKNNGGNDSMPTTGFFCCTCRSHVNSEESLRLHLNGGKHRKNCESP